MKIITQRQCIKEGIAAFLEHYSNWLDREKLADGLTLGQIRKNLKLLDPETCTSEDVDKALNVTGWARLVCDECEQPKEIVISFSGGEDEFPGHDVCMACLEKAVIELRAIAEPARPYG